MAIADTDLAVSPNTNVDWGAVFAGAAVASALGLILLGFGAALGLSVSSPYEGEGLSPAAFAVAAGLYLLWVQLMSFYIGGYIAARLRPRAPISEHEADVRDGLHGLVVWGVGVIAAGVIAFAGIGGVGVAARLPDNQAASSAIQSASQEIDEAVNQAAAAETVSNPEAVVESTTERRAEIARKLSVISAFITAASLLAGAVAAFIGAHAGGNHRDKNVVWAFFTAHSRMRG